jgi:hypothetical protein
MVYLALLKPLCARSQPYSSGWSIYDPTSRK